MALSMDEQRMLAEIEMRLAAEDPGLASRLSAFRRPGASTGFRSTRGKVIGSICVVVLLAIVGLTVYAMLSMRAHSLRSQVGRRPAATSSASAPSRAGASASAGNQ